MPDTVTTAPADDHAPRKERRKNAFKLRDGVMRRGNTWSYVIRVKDPETACFVGSALRTVVSDGDDQETVRTADPTKSGLCDAIHERSRAYSDSLSAGVGERRLPG